MSVRLLLTLFLLQVAAVTYATHIVGGEMRYRCLGGQQFEIILTVYRDCYNGVPFFDDPASIGLFNAGNVLVNEFKIPFVKDDTLITQLDGDCFVLPPSACVHTTTYKTIVTLPISPGGYTLSYQRCCRNKTIQNIMMPDSVGATFSIYISENALTQCNTSPVFKEWPPIYICVDEPIHFDHSAIDEEGDSIVYRLCTPLDGASLQNPRPQPPFNPPYKEVAWRDPPYNLNNVLGGVPLSIDPHTGLLTGIPSTIGQFVVGVCADEYKEGKLISSTRRDFQYNIGICGKTVSAFFVPELNCGFDVKFFNNSANADQYKWYFDWPNDTSLTSMEVNPTFTYSKGGTYTVMLIAQPGDPCVDTSFHTLKVIPPSLNAEFSYKFTECTDSLTVQFTDLSSDSLYTITSWDWTLSSGTRIYKSDILNPTFKIDTAGVWVAQLIVTADSGCSDTFRVIFPVRLANIPWPDTTVYICLGDTILLNPMPIPGVTHLWSPNLYLSSASTANPFAWPPVTTTYKLKTLAMAGLCQDEREITVIVSEPFEWTIPNDTAVCSSPFIVEGWADRPLSWIWSLNPQHQPPIAIGNPATIDHRDSTWIYVFVSDSLGCNSNDSLFITWLGLEIHIPDTLLLCPEESFDISFELANEKDTLIHFEWGPAEFFPISTTTNPATLLLQAPGYYSISLVAENQFGCQTTVHSFVTVIDPDTGDANISWTHCSDYRVTFTLNTPGAWAYEWDFGDPTLPGWTGAGAQVEYQYPGPGIYHPRLRIISDGSCIDTIDYTIELNDPVIRTDFSWSYITCADTASILLSDLTMISGSVLTIRKWYVNGFFIDTSENISWLVKGQDSFIVTLIIQTEDGCSDTLSRKIAVPVIDIDFPEEYTICPGDSILLNPDGNTQYDYLWSPEILFTDPTAASPVIHPDQDVTVTLVARLTDNPDCEFTYTIPIHIQSPPLLYIPADTVTCLQAVFLVIHEAADYQIRWYADPGYQILLGTDTSLFQLVAGEKRYYLTIQDDQGCIWTNDVLVRSAALNVSLPPNMVVCPGDSICIDALLAGDTSAIQLIWNVPVPYVLSEDQLRMCFLPVGTSNITMLAENLEGCQDIASTTVMFSASYPVIHATADPPITIPGSDVQLSVNQAQGWTYLWSPPQFLNDPMSPEPVATITEETVFYVTVTDANGCPSVDSVRIRMTASVCDEPYIFIPNTFTPNGDNHNDILYVRGLLIDELYWIIYDRWGNEVFSTTQKEEGWNGTYKGKALPTDVFGYYLEARCYQGETFKKKGNVTLLRN